MPQPVAVDYDPFAPAKVVPGSKTYAPDPPALNPDLRQLSPDELSNAGARVTPEQADADIAQAGGVMLPPVTAPALANGPDKTAPYGLAGLVTGKTMPALSPGASRAYADTAKDYTAQTDWMPKPMEAFEDHLGNGMTFSWYPKLVGAEYGAVQGMQNVVGGLTGQAPKYSMGDAYNGARQLVADKLGETFQNHPIASMGGELTGAVAAPGMGEVGQIVTAPSKVAKLIPSATAAGRLAAKAVDTGSKAARGIGAGYALGALSGAGAAEPGQELQGAQAGGNAGAVTGLMVPAAGKVAQVAADRVGVPLLNTAVRAANRATGGALLDPTKTAMSRLAEAFRADGIDDHTAATAISQWQATGSPPPYLMNIGGNNVRRLLRAAAAKMGPASNAAQDFADTQAVDLQPTVLSRTRQLPAEDSRSAEQAQADITAQLRSDADTMYHAPYAVPVDAAPITSAMEGDAGQQAIKRAYKGADALRLPDQRLELSLLKGRPAVDPAQPADTAATGLDTTVPAGPMSLGALDRIKVALNDMGREAEEQGHGDLANGYYARAREIDNHLADASAEYAAARDTYAGHSRSLDALKAGDFPISDDPASVRFRLGEVDPAKLGLVQLGQRQNLAAQLGAPTEGAVGALNKIAKGSNAGENLAAVFGPEQAANYRASLRNAGQRVDDARFVAPNPNSKTSGVILDQQAVETPKFPKSLTGLIASGLDKLRRGATMTDAERMALIRLGQMHVTPDTEIPIATNRRMVAPVLLPAAAARTGAVAGSPQ